MSRDIASTWDPNRSTYGTWAGRITTSTLLAARTCGRSDCGLPIAPGTKAIAFAGTDTAAFYHQECAKALGIRPAS